MKPTPLSRLCIGARFGYVRHFEKSKYEGDSFLKGLLKVVSLPIVCMVVALVGEVAEILIMIGLTVKSLRSLVYSESETQDTIGAAT